MMTTVSWSGTVRVKPASTGFAPKLLWRSWNWIIAAAPAPRTRPARAAVRPNRRPRGWCSGPHPPRRRASQPHDAPHQRDREPEGGALEQAEPGVLEAVLSLQGHLVRPVQERHLRVHDHAGGVRRQPHDAPHQRDREPEGGALEQAEPGVLEAIEQLQALD